MSRFIQNMTGAALLLLAGQTGAAELSYGEMVRTKLASGLTNMSFGIFEMPKNIINTSNEVNVLLGVSGGAMKGALHTAGRLLGGSLDFITFLVPSQPITHPAYVWDDFKSETTYGPFFDMSRNPQPHKPVAMPPPVRSSTVGAY